MIATRARMRLEMCDDGVAGAIYVLKRTIDACFQLFASNSRLGGNFGPLSTLDSKTLEYLRRPFHVVVFGHRRGAWEKSEFVEVDPFRPDDTKWIRRMHSTLTQGKVSSKFALGENQKTLESTHSRWRCYCISTLSSSQICSYIQWSR